MRGIVHSSSTKAIPLLCFAYRGSVTVYPSPMHGEWRIQGSVRRLALAFLVVLLLGVAVAQSAAAAPWTGRTFPARYDLRKVARVTRVGEQKNHSTCWIFAAVGSLESCLLPGTRLDLSENHMADFQGSTLRFEGRAPSTISAAYVARWEGPVLERSDPYPHPGASREGLRAVRHVQEVLFLPRHKSPRANAAIKWAVMRYGAVDATMAYAAWSFNRATTAYYSRDTDLDHHVCIVGWDDAYPAGRFLRRPPGPGAFLIKNSWGTDWGQRGYFWVSYYDRMLGTTLTVFNGVEGRANHDAIYQHDALGWSKSIGFHSTTAWFAARYTSGGDGSVTAASFYTPEPGTAYEVRVAPAVDAIATAPIAGAGTIAVGGYHTVTLKSPYAVTDGVDFVIAVRLTTPSSQKPIPVEYPTRLLRPRPAVGRSFISPDGVAWKDLRSRAGFGSSDVCLKAFVDSAGARDGAAPRVRVEAATAAAGGIARVRFTLSDPAFSSGSAVVKLRLVDGRGKTWRSVRIPAASVNERDTWRFRAPKKRGDYKVVARAWDVAGHGPATRTAPLRIE
jgi:C1A family cysteine protease